MCILIYIHICICMYICIYVHIYIYIYVYEHINMYIHIYIYLSIYLSMDSSIYIYTPHRGLQGDALCDSSRQIHHRISFYIYLSIYLYIYISLCKCMYTHTHAYILIYNLTAGCRATRSATPPVKSTIASTDRPPSKIDT